MISEKITSIPTELSLILSRYNNYESEIFLALLLLGVLGGYFTAKLTEKVTNGNRMIELVVGSSPFLILSTVSLLATNYLNIPEPLVKDIFNKIFPSTLLFCVTCGAKDLIDDTIFYPWKI